MKVEKPVYRFLSDRLPTVDQRRLVVLTGSRQVGKTTLARRAYPSLRYVNLDDSDAREALRLARPSEWGEVVGPAVLDEAQKEPSLFDKVKFAYDEGSLPFSVLLGSSRFLLLDQIKETLAGRAFVFELFPLLAAEVMTLDGSLPVAPLFDRLLVALLDPTLDVSAVLQAEPSVLLPDQDLPRRRALEHIAQWGGMPELLHLDDGDRREWLRSYQQTFLERDLPDIARLDDIIPFRNLERLSMAHTGQLVEYSALARDAGISPTTARRYLGYLSLAHQVVFLPPYSRNITSQVVKAPKLYWADLGLLLRGDPMVQSFVGAGFETLVVTEAHKWIHTRGRNVDLSFYRTRSGMEVDLIVSANDAMLAIEVKARDHVVPSDLRGLRALAAAAPPGTFRGGLCVYRGNRIECLDPELRLWAVPGHRLFTAPGGA